MATVASPRDLHPVQSANILIQHPDRNSIDPSIMLQSRLSDMTMAAATPPHPRHPIDLPARHRSQRFRRSTDTHPNSRHMPHTAADGNDDAHSTRSSDGAAPEPIPWGPAHPDFPHPNPHVPLTSAQYSATRIIRVARSYEAVGDLAPTFDDTYPRNALQAHISQVDFYRLIESINERLIDAFAPGGARNVLDVLLGAVTLWAWEDLGLSRAKSRLRAVETWIEEWNRTKGAAGKYRVLPLRRTGYMSLDIEIPAPEIEADEGEGEEVMVGFQADQHREL